MATPNLGLDHIAEGQTNKETTANEAFDGLDQAANSLLTLAITGDVNLTDVQFRQTYVTQFTGTPGSGFVVTIPTGIKKAFAVSNETDSAVSLEMEDAASDAITVLSGATAILYSTGTSIMDLGGGTTAGSGGGGGTTITIEDEGGEVVAPTRLNFVGAGVNASENSDGTVDILVPGGGGGTSITIEDEGGEVVAPSRLNFVGAGVSASENSAGTVDVTFEGPRATSIIEVTADFEITNAHLAGNVIIEVNNASPVTCFLEAGTTGTEPVTIIQTGAGQVTFVDASAVSMRSRGGTITAGRYAAVSVVPHGSDSFYLIGDLSE